MIDRGICSASAISAMVVIAMNVLAACSQESAEPALEMENETPVAELMGQGEAMVENLCASCHAIKANDQSLHPDAPALRDLSKHLHLEDLRGPLTEGTITGHPDMPEWAFEPHHVDALLYYLERLQSE